MIGQNRILESLHVFGMDGEKPLIDAFHHEFKSAVHLTTLSVFISSLETLESAMESMTKLLVFLITFAYNTRNGDLSYFIA